jgi:SnoaL-like domain
MPLPEDPAGFVARSAEAPELDMYAEDAVLELGGGMHRGRAEIRRAWEGWVGELGEVTVCKTLTSASGDTIACSWEAWLGSRVESKGIEYWRFDSDGQVYEHRVYGHEAVEPPVGLRERLRLATVHPRAALGLLRRRGR